MMSIDLNCDLGEGFGVYTLVSYNLSLNNI